MGAASHVLLKNVDHTLPLKRPRSMILVGSDAGPPPLGPNFYHDRFITPEDRTGVLAMGESPHSFLFVRFGSWGADLKRGRSCLQVGDPGRATSRI